MPPRWLQLPQRVRAAEILNGGGGNAESRRVMGEAFGEDETRFLAQRLFEYDPRFDRRRHEKMQLRVVEQPALATAGRDSHGQRRAEGRNHRAVGDRQFFRGGALAPVGELVEYPLAMFADQRLDVAESRLLRRADAQAALVDGETDGAPPAASQAVVDVLAGNRDAARCLRLRWSWHPRSDAGKSAASRLLSSFRRAD